LVLAGVRIAGERGLLGHSDADAIAHAVSDALLGVQGAPGRMEGGQRGCERDL
jgi:2C-methyl-D-erythritol 2,4-cyclodiphosphate synthase